MSNQEEINKLQIELNKLKKELKLSVGTLIKKSDKGKFIVKVPNQNFPVTLAKEQWEFILNNKDSIIEYMNANT